MRQAYIKTACYFTLFTFSSSLLFAHGGAKHEKKKPTETSIKKDIAPMKTPTKSLEQEETIISPKRITSVERLQNISKTHNPTKEQIKQIIYNEINTAYLSNIKPIFEKKCFDCHGTLQKKPWYYDLPLISYMIQKDIEEAKEHMDMTQDFPFVSHDSPYNDLKSIKDIGLEGGMPPLKYIIGHWDASLTKGEQKALIQWSQSAMQKLKDKGLHSKSELSH